MTIDDNILRPIVDDEPEVTPLPPDEPLPVERVAGNPEDVIPKAYYTPPVWTPEHGTVPNVYDLKGPYHDAPLHVGSRCAWTARWSDGAFPPPPLEDMSDDALLAELRDLMALGYDGAGVHYLALETSKGRGAAEGWLRDKRFSFPEFTAAWQLGTERGGQVRVLRFRRGWQPPLPLGMIIRQLGGGGWGIFDEQSGEVLVALSGHYSVPPLSNAEVRIARRRELANNWYLR